MALGQIDTGDEWRSVTHEASEEYIRAQPEIEYPHLLRPFLPIGLTVIYGAAGSGKSMMAQQIEHCVAWGVPLGGLVPEERVRCLVVDLEGNRILTQQRSLNLLPFGALPTDRQPDQDPHSLDSMIFYRYYTSDIAALSLTERFAHLWNMLEGARLYGAPYRYVRIDTMRLFLGVNAKKENAYEWDATNLKALNHLALEQRVAIVLVHHPNKAGDVSGSVAVAGTAVQVLKLERTKGTYEGVLASEKNRVAAEFQYPIEMVDGGWQFTDRITVEQAKHTGAPRAVLDVIADKGAVSKQELIMLTDLPEESIKKATFRLKSAGVIEFCNGLWTFTVKADLTKHIPQQRTEEAVPERTPEIPAPRSPVEAPAPQEDDDTEEEEALSSVPQSAFDALEKSILSSRKHPVPLIRKADRDQERWTIAERVSDGRHRWFNTAEIEYADRAQVAILDDNGRYIAACSSVPVCANVLNHTGPMELWDFTNEIAGNVLIQPLPWPVAGIGHAAGVKAERAAAAEQPLWISTPTFRLLRKLGLGYTMEILDSYTGPSATNLFEDYYVWARDEREKRRGDDEAYALIKRKTSIALRMLYPKSAKSRFWRPDWHVAMVGEANVRHWCAAEKVRQAGETLLGVLNTDETAVLKPFAAIDMPDWIPGSMRAGRGLGEVKVKENIPYTQWRGDHGGEIKRAR